jgi:hypothetical protein
MTSYQTNITTEADALQTDESWEAFLYYHVAAICVIIVLVIFGNMMTLISLVKFHHLRRQKNALIGSLALADLCLGISTIIWILYSMAYGGNTSWDPPDILLTLFAYISNYHLYTIGIDRFIAVVKPLHYPMLVTRNTTIIMILITWVFPVVSILPLYIYTLRQDVTYSLVNKAHQIATITTYAINILVMSFIYGRILAETRAQLRKIQDLVNQGADGNTHNKRVSNKGTRLVMMILSAAALLNFPMFVSVILLAAGIERNLPLSMLSTLAQEWSLSNSCVNFFIYAAFFSDFKKAYINLLCSCKKSQITNVETLVSTI